MKDFANNFISWLRSDKFLPTRFSYSNEFSGLCFTKSKSLSHFYPFFFADTIQLKFKSVDETISFGSVLEELFPWACEKLSLRWPTGIFVWPNFDLITHSNYFYS